MLPSPLPAWRHDQVLALSDERDQWEARLLEAEKRAYDAGHARGHDEGFLAGWEHCEQLVEEWHRGLARKVIMTVQQRDALAGRALRSAEAWQRRWAAWWWDECNRRQNRQA